MATTTETPITTITRDQLRRVAAAALNRAGVEHESRLEAEVFEVAETAEKVLGSVPLWWSHREECGCLIGTIRPGVSDPPGLGTPAHAVGLEYMPAMREVLGVSDTAWDTGCVSRSLTVVD